MFAPFFTGHQTPHTKNRKIQKHCCGKRFAHWFLKYKLNQRNYNEDICNGIAREGGSTRSGLASYNCLDFTPEDPKT